MAAPWKAHRRRRFAPRAHDIGTRPADLHAGVRIPVRDEPEVRWWRIGELDHAFSTGAGYLRSKCKAVRWDVTAVPWTFAEPSAPCPDCELLVNGTEAELREAFGG